ncbi:MAG: Yip1 family protein [Methanocorpusculum sp.]|nr:Yip1 family protein [Methanocorpusculum sp.]
MHQYYASPILVKNQQYYATLTSERLIIEGGNTREFRVSAIDGAYPAKLENNEPGLKIVISTQGGKKDMLWGFPVDGIFKAGEQDAWINNISKAIGDKPFEQQNPAARVQQSAAFDTNTQAQSGSRQILPPPSFQHGETEILNTAGVRIKRGYYTIYLTNLRLILQNNTGKVGREFAIAELMDAAEVETESREYAIALSVGSQSGPKQMLLTFPTKMSRDAWMRELKVKLPSRKPLIAEQTTQKFESQPSKLGTFVPAKNEKLIASVKDVRIKSNFVILHLTNTRLVIEGPAGIVGEFAVNALLRVMRMAGELGEPGIALLVGARDGEKEMHLVFQSMELREDWMQSFEEVLQSEPPSMFVPESQQYTVSTVLPHQPQNSNEVYCKACGAKNHVDDENCAMCGLSLKRDANDVSRADEKRPVHRERRVKEPKQRREPREPRAPRAPRPPRVKKEKAPYNGGLTGFIFRPADAFQYHFRETPKDALATFLLSGGIWAVVTTLLIAFLVPAILKVDTAQFPIISALQNDAGALFVFILMLFVLWVIAVLIRSLICALIARICDPSTDFSEIIAIVMRTTLTYAAVGWIPIIGIFVSAIWSAAASAKGLIAGENMQSGQAFASSFAAVVILFVILFAVGSIGGT